MVTDSADYKTQFPLKAMGALLPWSKCNLDMRMMAAKSIILKKKSCCFAMKYSARTCVILKFKPQQLVNSILDITTLKLVHKS